MQQEEHENVDMIIIKIRQSNYFITYYFVVITPSKCPMDAAVILVKEQQIILGRKIHLKRKEKYYIREQSERRK